MRKEVSNHGREPHLAGAMTRFRRYVASQRPFRRLALECLEEKTLLSADGLGVSGGAMFSPAADVGQTIPQPTAISHGDVILYGEGETPPASATGSDLDILLKTSRAVDADFTSLTLYIAFDGNGFGTVSTSVFDPETAGFQLGNISGETVPDVTVSGVFADNLIANDRYAVYLYSGSDITAVQSEWFFKVVWFDLSFSGDWTKGAETVTEPLRLMTLHFQFDPNLVYQTTTEIGITADAGEGWNVDARPWTLVIPGEASPEVTAVISPNQSVIQAGCSMPLSGGASFSAAGSEIVAWHWDVNGDGVTDLEGENVVINADQISTVNGVGTVGLMVENAAGNVSSSATASVTVTPVAPSVTTALTAYRGGQILNARFDYVSFSGTAGAFWEIDWGDGSDLEKMESHSFSLTAAHCYATSALSRTYRVTLRVTDDQGKAGSIFWITDHEVAGSAAALLPTESLSTRGHLKRVKRDETVDYKTADAVLNSVAEEDPIFFPLTILPVSEEDSGLLTSCLPIPQTTEKERFFDGFFSMGDDEIGID